MTLVEIMVATAVFTLAGMAILGASIMARRLSETNALEMTAQVVAQGYLEQLKAIEYWQLAQPSLPTQFHATNAETLTVGQWNRRALDVNNTPNNPNDDLLFELLPTLEDQLPTASRYPCFRILLEYRWQSPDSSSGRMIWRRNSIQAFRAKIPTT